MSSYPQIINFKSKPKETPFAPEWNYFLIEDMIKDVDFKSLAQFILSKEKIILNLSPYLFYRVLMHVPLVDQLIHP